MTGAKVMSQNQKA